MASTQDVVQQLLGSIASDPSMLSSLMEHPYSTIGKLTGNEDVSKEEASQVVAATSALAAGQSVDFSNLAGLASQLLGDNGGSVHQLATAMLSNFAGGSGDAAQSGISADVISNLAGVVFGGGTANNEAAIDLSDGIGIDDVMGIVGKLFGK